MTARHSRVAPVLILLVGGLVVALVGLPPAAADEHRSRLGDDPSALRLLAAAAQAQAQVAYEGVQYVMVWEKSGTISQIVEITHSPLKGSVVTVRGTAAVPGTRVIAPAHDSSDAVGLLARNYALVRRGIEQVAGRPGTVVEARRPGGSVAARFWLDRETALMLRREVYDRAGQAVRASSFVEITIGRTRPADGPEPGLVPRQRSNDISITAVESLRGQGWTVPGAIQPTLSLYHVSVTANELGPIVHLSYSDGLSTVSLFEQRGHLAADNLAGSSKVEVGGAPVYVYDGLPYRASWSADGVVYTVVADAPEEVAHAVIAALPREREENGVLSRVGRGMSRIASWFNPFG